MTPPAASAPPRRRPEPPIDPRLRARRIAVKRDEGRRRLRRVVVAVVAAALLSGAAAATRSPLLDVDHVTVTGATRTPAGAVLDAAGIARGEPMTDVEVGEAAAAVEALPWVADAHVRRRWPGRVEIAVRERTPVATGAAAGGGHALLDATGRVLEHVAEPPGDLPAVAGPPVGAPGVTAPAGVLEALTVAGALPASLRPGVREVVVGEDGIRLALRGGATVELGRAEGLEEKLLAVLTVLDDTDAATIAVLDVRVPSAPVLTRRG